MSPSGFSAQTLSVLAALCDQPSQWQHGYALAKQTGLKSGTLYPILIRLAGQGLLEACWQDEPQPGRPRRHLYRLTAAGLASATAAPAFSGGVWKTPARSRGRAPGRSQHRLLRPAGTRPGTRRFESVLEGIARALHPYAGNIRRAGE
jgi:PadR family transcriptional regulator PadR